MLPAYQKIEQFYSSVSQQMIGHHVYVTEKVDGSQISFGIINNELMIRSRHNSIPLMNPPKMFQEAVGSIVALCETQRLTPGLVYRGEYLSKPKHNVITYARVPEHNIILYDVDTWKFPLEDTSFCSPFEYVPFIWSCNFEDITQEMLDEWLDRESILGGSKIEGVVIKAYSVIDSRNNQPIMVKYVSPRFKEIAKQPQNDSKMDVFSQLAEMYGTEARYQKAYQHLQEQGKITDTLKDIGPLIGEVCRDIHEECGDEIKEKLSQWAWKLLGKRFTVGVPDFYKKKLAELYPPIEEVRDEN